MQIQNPRLVCCSVLVVACVCVGVSRAEQKKVSKTTEFQTVVVLKPGGEKTVTICWDNVPGGRFPAIHFSSDADRPTVAPGEFEGGKPYKRGGIVVSYDKDASIELGTRLDTRDFPSQDGRIYMVFLVAVSEDAGPTTTDIYVHYISGTGRTIYRRAAVRVVVTKLRDADRAGSPGQ